MINGIDQPIDSLSDLDDQERETLKEWTDFFTNKYTMIGYLVEQGFEDK